MKHLLVGISGQAAKEINTDEELDKTLMKINSTLPKIWAIAPKNRLDEKTNNLTICKWTIGKICHSRDTSCRPSDKFSNRKKIPFLPW